MLLLVSEINKINRNSFDFHFDRILSKLYTKPKYGNGALSGIRFSLHANEAWGEIDGFTLSSCLRLETASVGTNDFYMPPTRQIKQTKTAWTHDWERIWN